MQYRKFNNSIVKNIDKFRVKKGISSWSELAYQSGISSGTIADIKNGKVEAKLSTLVKIAITLNVPLSEFFNGDFDFSEFDI